jgi:hypothetical protein
MPIESHSHDSAHHPQNDVPRPLSIPQNNIPMPYSQTQDVTTMNGHFQQTYTDNPQYPQYSLNLTLYKHEWQKITDIIKSKNNDHKSITLANDEPFSDMFTSLLGDNAFNIQVLPDEWFQVDCVESLADYRALCKLLNNKISGEFGHISNFNNGDTHISISKNQNRIQWTAYHNGAHKSGIDGTSLMQFLYSIPRKDAVATWAKLLGIDPEKVFKTYNVKHVAESDGRHYDSTDIPYTLFIKSEDSNTNVAILKNDNPHFIYGHARQIIGAIAEYQLGNKIFFLPATIGNGSLCIGQYQATAHLLNQNEMDANPRTTILLCQDIRLALRLDAILNEVPISKSEFIVSGFYGEDLSVLPWNYLFSHDVILLCAPIKDFLARVSEYKTKIADADARSFKVYPFPLLHANSREFSEEDSDSISNNAEYELLKNVINLDTCERPSVLSHLNVRI